MQGESKNKETYKDDSTRNELVKKLLEGKFSTSKELELLFGIEIVWVETNFDGLIPALKSGKIDMIASAMSATDERRQSVDF
ncbi:transporter substrate-binding domain-containing protein, partial [Campylobacter coli]